MKISILIPEDLVIRVHKHANARDKNESICAVLNEWIILKELENSKKPERDLEYLPGFEKVPKSKP